MTFRSVIPALLTPFQDDLSLAPERLAENARGSERGIGDVVVCGTMGEAGALSEDERRVVIETAIASGARVTVGISSPDGPGAASRAEDAAALGAIGVMCLPPTTYVADERELDAHFAAVTSATDLPVMLYNNPEAARQDLRPETIVRLAERHERIVAVKECSGDARRIAHLVELVGDRLEILVEATTGRSRAMPLARSAGCPAWRTWRPSCVSSSSRWSRRAISSRPAAATPACCRSRGST